MNESWYNSMECIMFNKFKRIIDIKAITVYVAHQYERNSIKENTYNN